MTPEQLSDEDRETLHDAAPCDPDQTEGWEWSILDQAVESILAAHLADVEARLAAVEALHRPWYEANGVRHDHTVLASGDDVPADHVCRIGPEHQACLRYDGDPAEDEHEVLACVECRQTTADGETGYLFWPCPTVRALHPIPDDPA